MQAKKKPTIAELEAILAAEGQERVELLPNGEVIVKPIDDEPSATKPSLTMPTIHDNGTPRHHLFEDYASAADAIEKAMRAVGRSAPNGRDYPTPEAFDCAIREHDKRQAKLAAVKAELIALYDYCVTWEANS